VDFHWILVDYQRNPMDISGFSLDFSGLPEESNGLSVDSHWILVDYQSGVQADLRKVSKHLEFM